MPNFKNLKIDEVDLDYSNPRIALMLERWGGKDNITADAVAMALGQNGDSSFEVLKESIKVNNGIIQPIIVNHINNHYVVIEGNTRLQIYKDLREEMNGTGNEENWNEIIAIVHENLGRNQVDAIRLQSHLVGPRDWDPYAKSKYLHTLYYSEYLSINEIISYCGGKTSEVKKMINAYEDMTKYFVPLLNGQDIPHKKFSAFMELQNKKVLDAIQYNKYTKEDFASWVLNDNIDKMANVRMLPEILPDKNARNVFLKENCTEAYKLIAVPGLDSGLLKDASYLTLSRQLQQRLNIISAAFVKKMSEGDDTTAYATKTALYDLKDILDETLEMIEKM
ncbi:MAG: ParB N-terminal domain-containing protein [Bacilli bacterium]